MLVTREQFLRKKRGKLLKVQKPKAKKQTYFPGCLSVLGACLGSFLRDKTGLVVPSVPRRTRRLSTVAPGHLPQLPCVDLLAARAREATLWGCGAVGSSCPRGGPGAQVKFYKKQIYGEVSEWWWWWWWEGGVPLSSRRGFYRGLL